MKLSARISFSQSLVSLTSSIFALPCQVSVPQVISRFLSLTVSTLQLAGITFHFLNSRNYGLKVGITYVKDIHQSQFCVPHFNLSQFAAETLSSIKESSILVTVLLLTNDERATRIKFMKFIIDNYSLI